MLACNYATFSAQSYHRTRKIILILVPVLTLESPLKITSADSTIRVTSENPYAIEPPLTSENPSVISIIIFFSSKSHFLHHWPLAAFPSLFPNHILPPCHALRSVESWIITYFQYYALHMDVLSVILDDSRCTGVSSFLRRIFIDWSSRKWQ